MLPTIIYIVFMEFSLFNMQINEIINSLDVLYQACLCPDNKLMKWLLESDKSFFVYEFLDGDKREKSHNYVSWIVLALAVTHQFSLADEIVCSSKRVIRFSLEDIHIGRNIPALKYLLQKQKKGLVDVQFRNSVKVWFLEQSFRMLNITQPEKSLVQYLPEGYACPHVQAVVDWINKTFACTPKFSHDDMYLYHIIEKACSSLGDETDTKTLSILRVLYSYNKYDLIEKIFQKYGFFQVSLYDVFYGNDFVALEALLNKYPDCKMYIGSCMNNYEMDSISIKKASVEMFQVLSDHFDKYDDDWLCYLFRQSLYLGNFSLTRAIMEKYPEEAFYNTFSGNISSSHYHCSSINYYALLNECFRLVPTNDPKIIKHCFKKACCYGQTENVRGIIKDYPSIVEQMQKYWSNIYVPKENRDIRALLDYHRIGYT